MSDSRYRVLLKVVRRQPMIFGTDKGLEERPRPACGLSQKEYLVTGQPGTAADQGPAYPPGDGRRGGPQQQYGKRNEARSGHGDRDADRRGDSDRWRDPHEPKGRVEVRPTAACHRLIGFSIDLPRRAPFEKPAMSDQHPKQRAQDCVEAQIGLVRQTRQREQHLTEMPPCRVHRRDDVLRQQYLGRFPQ